MIWKDYASGEGVLRAQKYQYASNSRSILYKYIYSPVAQKCVDILPRTLAPNIITVIAFLFSFFPHVLIMLHAGEDLTMDIPPWLCLISGLGQFLYMHFDNMDGKQARRIGAASPLGMLYDHGLDSVTGWIIGISLCHILKVGNSKYVFLAMVLSSMVCFYLTFWEQNYTGIFAMGVFSPVDEGTTMINILEIMVFFVGPAFLDGPVFMDLTLGQTFVLFGSFFAIILAVGNLRTVFEKHPEKKQHALRNLECLVLLCLAAVIVSFLSPTSIADRRVISLVYCFGLSFCKVIGHFQLAHCTREEFNPWRTNFVITMMAFIMNTVVGYFHGKCPIDEDLLLNGLIIMNLFCYLHYLICISRQFSRVLNINIFSVPPPNEPTINSVNHKVLKTK